MSSWDEGYVSEIDYTYGYYLELNPHRIKLAFALAGLHPPEVKTAVELGFGQGMSVLLHGAASDISWYGNDFNPAQAAFARSLANEGGLKVDLTDESFAEFCSRDDLPEFDFIGLHGIWSWVNDANRQIIVDFIARKLRVGGVVYLSYNTMPGWGVFSSMRHLMSLFDARMSATGSDRLTRVADAMEFGRTLLDAQPNLAKQIPLVRDRFDFLMKQDRHYLAHELFNQDWHPFHFSQTASLLAPAKLGYACSAQLLDAVTSINLTESQRAQVDAQKDPLLRESVRDIMVNQTFRRDYWVKGLRRLTDFEHGAAIRALEIVLMAPPDAVGKKITGALGEAELDQTIYAPLVQALASFRPMSVADLAAAVPQVTFANVLQGLYILSSLAAIAVAVPATAESIASAQRMNMAICQRALTRADIGFLASPVTGGGIPTTRFQQIFLLARSEGETTPEAWSHYAWNVLKAQNQHLVKDGKTVEGDADNLAQLLSMAREFARSRLPLYLAHQMMAA